jgi:hypothetical protein
MLKNNLLSKDGKSVMKNILGIKVVNNSKIVEFILNNDIFFILFLQSQDFYIFIIVMQPYNTFYIIIHFILYNIYNWLISHN